MSTTNEKNTIHSSTHTAAEIIEVTRDWGRMHGRCIATCDDIHAAVRAGEPVGWLEEPDMLWAWRSTRTRTASNSCGRKPKRRPGKPPKKSASTCAGP